MAAGFVNLQHWGAIVPLYMAYGFSRGVYESSMKAIIAEFFPDNGEAAFAVLQVQLGFASSLALFLRLASKQAIPVAVVVFSVLGCVGCIAAHAVHGKLKGP